MMLIDRKKELTQVHLPKKTNTVPFKRSLSGYEIEFFTLDEEGLPTDSSKLFNKKLEGIKKECAKNMLEAVCMPHQKIRLATDRFLDILIQASEKSTDAGIRLFPFGTYPGKLEPSFWKTKRNTIQKKILGDRFVLAGMCCGFHHHYTLPRGMFDRRQKFIQYRKKSKISRSLIDSYNLLIALDPVCTLFLQSSPYCNGKYVAKDSRMALYRGGKLYKDGLYSKFQPYGALPHYKHTVRDLIHTIKRRDGRWRKLLASKNLPDQSKSMLDYAWNPVKINNKGTLEYRGGDANLMSIVFGVSTMIKFALRKVQQDLTLVVPIDIEPRDSFKIEGNVIFIPPHTLVRDKLQYASAHEGFASKELYEYAQSCLTFIDRITFKEYRTFLSPLKKMVKQKKTIADKMIRDVKNDKTVTVARSKKLSLQYAKLFSEDLYKTKEKTQRLI
jgi:hypothetical protein